MGFLQKRKKCLVSMPRKTFLTKKKRKEAEREEIKKMKVERGKPENIDQDAVKKKMEDEEYRLRVMMIKKKHKGLYKSMMKHRKKRVNESKQLERKRKRHDDEVA